MKPLYLDLQGADAPKWKPFARRKMQQYVDQLDRLGLEYGRKNIAFGDVSISFQVTPFFNKLRVEAAPAATFFALYTVNLTSPSTTTYSYLLAFDDDGNEKWRHAFGGHSTFSGFQRTLLGCSASGEKVLVREIDSSSVMTVKAITNGAVTSTDTFDLAAAGYSSSFDTGGGTQVSVDGSRAIFRGPILDAFDTQRSVFVYDSDLEDAIQVFEFDHGVIENVEFFLGASSDLSTIYGAFYGYNTSAGSQPPIPVTRITRIEGDTPHWEAEEVELETPLGSSHFVAVGGFAVSPDGDIANAFTTITPPVIDGFTDVTASMNVYLHTGVVELTTAFRPVGASTLDSIRAALVIRSLTNEAQAIAFQHLTDITVSLSALTHGVIVDGAKAEVEHKVMAVSEDGSAKVLDTGSAYIVRRTEGDFVLTDADYFGGGLPHSFAGLSVYAGFVPMLQGGNPTTSRWVEDFVDEEMFVGYPERSVLGNTPVSITVTPIEAEETASRRQILNVYPLRVIQS